MSISNNDVLIKHNNQYGKSVECRRDDYCRKASSHTGGTLLRHGLSLILAGLVFGICVPSTPYPRLALGAHIQFVTSGMLFVLLALVLLNVPHNVGPASMRVMVLSAWLAWLMALSEAANAWWGANQMLPLAAKQAGATAGASAWQEAVVTFSHLLAALCLIVSLALLLLGVVRHRKRDD